MHTKNKDNAYALPLSCDCHTLVLDTGTVLFMRLLSYEKGELLNPPFASLQQFLLIVEGNIVIYHISKDGSIHHVSHEGNGTLLGDIEFSGSPYQTLFIEALEQVIALSIPFEPNRDVLENDPVFLKVLLRHLADKLSLSSTLDIMADNLEERLLVYMKTIQPDHRITSVNHAMQALHCSRRQLQRVLKKLCEQGILMHERKGHYILAKQKAFPQ